MFGEKPGFIVAGLGNPGPDYKGTRHNCGFLAADYIAAKTGADVKRKRFSALCGTASIGNAKALIMKPLTYMNLSGDAVAAAARYYHIPPERVIILCDDINIPCGVLRVREKGSAGGHNGLKSIIACLGSDAFLRVRIGVGDKNGGDLRDYVLGEPSKAETQLIADRLPDVMEAVLLLTEGRAGEAMSRVNGAKRQ